VFAPPPRPQESRFAQAKANFWLITALGAAKQKGLDEASLGSF
jgi:hypothetical protein